tara:strand:- start:4483 stop:4833 length:351 start_codon:yes stop_codon:yes gene_type:complete
MRDIAVLTFLEPGNDWDNIQITVKGRVVTSVIILNKRELILNLLQQLRKSLSSDNKSSLIVTVNERDFNLDYDGWRALLYVLEHWFDYMINDEWDSYLESLSRNQEISLVNNDDDK